MESRQRSGFPADLAGFVHSFSISDDMIGELVTYAEKQGVHLHDEAGLKNAVRN